MIYDRHFLFSDSRFIEQADHRFKPVVVFTFIAFGAAGILKTAKHTFVLFAVSFLMGGGMTALYYIINSFLESRKIYINGTVDTLYSDIPVWLLAMLALFCALISFVWGRITRASAEKRQVDVIVRDEKSEVHFQGLCDS